jgi:hypothetical protein
MPAPTLSSADGAIRFFADIEGEDYYLEADFDHSPEEMPSILLRLSSEGYDRMSYEECEHDVYFAADHTEDNYHGFTRAYAGRSVPRLALAAGETA